MKTTHEIKRWFKETFNIPVVGNTSAGKGKWQSFRIRPDPSTDFRYGNLKYSHEFPVALRKACLKVVYPGSDICEQARGGNIESHSLAMHQDEWEKVIAEWPKPALAETPVSDTVAT